MSRITILYKARLLLALMALTMGGALASACGHDPAGRVDGEVGDRFHFEPKTLRPGQRFQLVFDGSVLVGNRYKLWEGKAADDMHLKYLLKAADASGPPSAFRVPKEGILIQSGSSLKEPGVTKRETLILPDDDLSSEVVLCNADGTVCSKVPVDY